MKVLSIDVGIKNLALCTFDSASSSIQQWDVVCLGSARCDLAVAVKRVMDEQAALASWDRVVIEQQPGRNKRMKSVEHFLHMYCVCRGLPVTVFHAREKLAGTGVEHRGRSGQQYRARKKASVLLCRQWLEANPDNEAWLRMFDKRGTKKDDYADALNQALAFLKISNAATEATMERETLAVRARKPTEKQRSRGAYSKSNIKHFLTKDMAGQTDAETTASIQSDAKLLRAVLGHYASVADCIRRNKT
jgi:hypothetical protein